MQRLKDALLYDDGGPLALCLALLLAAGFRATFGRYP